MNTANQPISLFYSYDENEKDQELRDQLDKHLANLERQQLIKGWHKQKIQIGTDKTNAINEHLAKAQIILLLISADFIASDYLDSNETQRAIKQHNSGESFVIPVLLRPCEIKGTPFSQLDCLPSNAKPVTSWGENNQDAAFQDVATGIRKVVEEYIPRTKEQWLEEGQRCHRAKQYEKALVAYERALRQDPNYARAQRNKGDILYELKRYTDALAIYARALHLDPSSARTHRNMANILARIGQYGESLDVYKRAIQLAPTAKLYNEKGDAHFHLQDYEGALQSYEQAIKCDPTFVHAWNNKGHALYGLGRFQDAVAAYEQAIQLDPTFVLPYNNKGRALFYLKRYRESCKAYEAALRIDPSRATVYKNYAETLEKLGMVQEAADAQVKALALKNSKAASQA